jgi:hypothetical protein
MPLAQSLKPEGYAGDVFRTIDCKYAQRADQVSVHYSPKHQAASYGNLATCASVWACPVCCAKIQERRRPELASLVEWAYLNGHQAQMITFTFPHTRFDSLGDLLSKQRQAFKRLRSGKLWQAFKKQYGYVGLVRSLELLHGSHGWHPHTHEIFITKPLSGDDRTHFFEFIRSQWIKACASAGLLDRSDEKALLNFTLYSVNVQFKASSSDYLLKQDSGRAWGVDREVASSRSKVGKGVHPHEFLVRCKPGDKDRYLEFVQGMKGQRQLYWSTGLKKLVGVEDKTDQEKADELLEKAIILGSLSKQQWRLVRGNECRAQVLQAAEKGLWFSVLTLLARIGCLDSARHLMMYESASLRSA